MAIQRDSKGVANRGTNGVKPALIIELVQKNYEVYKLNPQ